MVRKLKQKKTEIKATIVKMKDNDYIINFDIYTKEIMERYYKALDLLEVDNFKEASIIFKNLTNQTKGHFDSINSLIGIYQSLHDLPNIAKSFNKGLQDMRYINSILPKDAKLPWSYSSNKGFLRFLYNLGIKYMDQNKLMNSKEVFMQLIYLDPSDSLDAKDALIEILFRLKDYEPILDITKTYQDESSVSILFNRILTLYLLNKKEEAKELIFNFNQDAINLYKSLEKNIRDIKPLDRYLAYDIARNKTKTYWNVFFSYWNNKDGALNFLEDNIDNNKLNNKCDDKLDFLEDFELSMKNENLKDITINGHLSNLDSFREILPDIDKVISKLEEEIMAFNKTLFTKTITSLNKFYSFITDDKDELKEIKARLKDLKDKLIERF